ncbi:hypothetical protein Moror_8848 [Moniliophthora roreri MCA 2997]|uniref:Uncharacterized protein n=2 Tax=Moniliophthora roreri TaxID=221103 RepID=V2XKY0_MONRO|nr:hypothetical protein Moror_8848 [Moniliophthora roreri MCA 2997]KAI3604335.1 hypothetical protein WG66_008536 [Moniliophthora roreri]
MAATTAEANVLGIWTVLDENSSGSEDELDQLAVFQNPSRETLSPATKLLASGSLQSILEDTRKPKKSKLLESSAKPQGNVSMELSTKPSSQWHDSDSEVEQGTSSWRFRGHVENATGSVAGPQRHSVHSHTRFASDRASNGSPHRQSTLADALSSAFMRNAEAPYPESEIKTLKTRQNRLGDAFSAPGSQRHQRNDRNAGLRRSRRHPLPISQEEIDEYLDVNVAPVSFGVANTNVPNQDAGRASELVTAFNRRHVLRSISKPKSTLPKLAWSATSHAYFSESYTAAYINRVSEWFGSESIDQVAKIDDRLVSMHPTPQIPRVIRPASPLNSGELANSDESSFEDTRSATPTPAVLEPLVTDSVLNGTKRDAGEMGGQYVKETERPKTTGLSDVPTLDETWSIQAHTRLLEKLLKGKTKLSEDEVKLIKKYLGTLERDDQTTISVAFKACRQEDKNAFLRTLSRLLELSDLGVSEMDDKKIRNSAAAILKTYDAAD